MHPILLTIGSFSIYAYGFFALLGFASGTVLFLYQAKRENLKKREIFFFLLCIIISIVIGARVFYILNYPYGYFENPQNILRIWQGGLVLYGGFLFAFAVGFFFIRRHHLPFWKIANMSAPSIALGISIGRIGCFLNGCCYGKPWNKGLVFSLDSPAGMAFPNQPLIPTQLISSVDMLAIFFILTILRRYKWFNNRSFLWLLILYSSHRFIIEFLRADSLRILLNLTFSQLLSIIIGVSAAVLMLFDSSLKVDILETDWTM